MDWDRIEANWKQFTATAKGRWTLLTDEHLGTIAGRRDQLAGKLQELYGFSKEASERQIDQWQKDQRESASGA